MNIYKNYFTQVICLINIVVLFSCNETPKKEFDLDLKPPVFAPFEGLDTITTNDWWNRRENPIIDVNVNRKDVIAFGIYTVSNKTLKLTAQLFPLFPNETREIRLEIKNTDGWEEIQSVKINDIGWSGTFKVENWDDSLDIEYRILHGEHASFQGVVRKNPINKAVISIAALSCNSNKDRGNRNNYIRNINHHNPDLVFFAGDQSYDETEHTASWLKFGLQFRDIFRQRPCITIPDDHDIGQGNLWGENGKIASTDDGDDGGYFRDIDYVNMVERCQTSHLPDPFDPTPINNNISVYYTSYKLGNIDIAIIEDRKFKSGPKGKIPQQGPRPDIIRSENFDPTSVDKEGLTLLGGRQLVFLNEWSKDTLNSTFKVVLSQTGFCNAAHLYGTNSDRITADMDSNGWPQKGRNKALTILQKAKAIHIAGDQHLASIIKHGIDDYDDGPWAFTVPAIVNNYYSRWWWPKNEKAGENSNGILPWNGRYLDGFNNKITMHAYANPDSPSNGSGYGLIIFNNSINEIEFQCWPRHVDVTKGEAKQFKGWPITIKP